LVFFALALVEETVILLHLMFKLLLSAVM